MDRFDVIEQLILTARCREQYCKSLLEQYHLRASELDVLLFLAQRRDMTTAKQICDERQLAKSLVSAGVETLVSRNLVERRTDPADRRRTLLSLRPEAEEILDSANAMLGQFRGRLCDGISTEDLQAFERVLRRMRHNMNEINAGN